MEHGSTRTVRINTEKSVRIRLIRNYPCPILSSQITPVMVVTGYVPVAAVSVAVLQPIPEGRSVSLDRQSLIPLYLQREDLLASRITEGLLQPGDALPSERQLCGELGLGRTTVRGALRDRLGMLLEGQD